MQMFLCNLTVPTTGQVLSVYSVQSLSRVRLCNPMNCSTPGFPVHHQLLKLAQTHVHRVSDAIQPTHALSSPSPPAFNLSQHQDLFQGVSSISEQFPLFLFILASSVCKSLQCLISTLTQGAKVITYLGSLVQLCCGE